MNIIFTLVLIASALILAFISPESFLSSMLSGAENSLKSAVTLFCIYAVWMGVSKVAEDAGLCEKGAKLLKPAVKKIFKTNDAEAAKNVSMNVVCNVLGLGGAATPFAVKAITNFDKEGNDFAQRLLFVLNATTLQIIPTTVIALRAAEGSQNASDIFLPTLICSLACTAVSVAIFLITERICRK